MSTKSPQQPIHPSVLTKLDPGYVEFHNTHILYMVPPDTLPWDPKFRKVQIPGASPPLEVGTTKDYNLPNAQFRASTPKGNPPVGGWPVVIYFHGGGWTLGGIDSEMTFATSACKGSSSVVVSVDYRLAPENPYPAAVNDAVDALKWVVAYGASELNVDTTKIALAGSSSGGNLAAILALKAVEMSPPVQIIFQLLIVPVTDNTASVRDCWEENQYAPWLSPNRMMWFRRNYLPNEEDWKKWDASPYFAPVNLLEKTPKAWIGLAELDILKGEGIAYGEKLKQAGVEVHVEIYKGAPHPIMAMNGELYLVS
ncbi:alpha/beta hydrolase fold-domain-containing protein [Cyathus striatus]|nr:alpha/beta hydrolase fold-domain-containing protein [Cyathus striatus]